MKKYTLQGAFEEVGYRYFQRLQQLDDLNFYCVNVGASDGVTLDVLYYSYTHGFSGLAIEPNQQKFGDLCANLPHLQQVQSYATPDNILDILDDNGVPIGVDAIDVDIDGYDFYVARSILSKYRPKIMSIEINQMIPPGILFSVLYDPDFSWTGGAFYGCSIDMACLLCDFYGYKLLTLDWIELFFVRDDYAGLFELAESPLAAYVDGYWQRENKQDIFHWEDEDFDPLAFSTDEWITKLKVMFADKEGRYFLAPTSHVRECRGLERKSLG